MNLFALAFVLGALCLQQMPVLPALVWVSLLVPIAFLTFRTSVGRFFFLGIFAFALGFFWAAGFATWRMSDELPKAWEVKSIDVEGVVATMPERQERGERFVFEVNRVLTPQAVVPKRIALTHYTQKFDEMDEVGEASVLPERRYHAGERWQLTVRLKRPHGTQNPHGFDFEAWALAENIRATGHVREKGQHQRLESFVWRPATMVERVREQIHDRISDVLQDKPYKGVLQALVVGDDNAIARDDWDVFLRTGTNHLMSISGLHITMLAGLAFGLVSFCWRRFGNLALQVPTRKAAVLAGVVTALLYALVAGFSVPTQRTLYMLVVFAWALWAGRSVSMARMLCIALLVVVVLDPWAVIAPGFWLSFGAVAIISYALGGRLRRPHWLHEAIKTQWAVTLGLTPLLLVMFQQFSIVSPLANAFAIPLISLLVVPLALLGSIFPLNWPLHFAHTLMQFCMTALQWLAALPESTWQQHAPPMWTLIPAMLGVLWLLLPRGFPLRYFGWLGFLPMLLIVPPKPPQGAMQVAVLDVGQGLAVVVQTAKHALLYDTGSRYSTQSDSGSRIIVPLLRGSGIRKLDGLVVSHNDVDHSGGMHSVLAQVPVGWMASSLPDELEIPAQAERMKCYAGQSWAWDGVDFEVLHPTLESYEDAEIKDNNRSCVLKIRSPYGTLLLTGDIEKEAEAELLERTADNLASDVLIVPHHGSKTSSTQAFVEAVAPKTVVYTVGYLNRFGHPKPVVMQRYAGMDAKNYRSDEAGALLMMFDGKQSPIIGQWRFLRKKYWHDVASSLAEKDGAS